MNSKQISFVIFFLLTVICWAGQETNAAPDTSYGRALVDRVKCVDIGYIFYCDVKDWPAVIGANIGVKIEGIEPPLIVAEEGGANKFFELQTKKFIETTLNKAKRIELDNIKRRESFGIVADIIVDSNSLASLLIENGYARLRTKTDIVKEKKTNLQKLKTKSKPVNPMKSIEDKKQVPEQTKSQWIASKNSKVFHRADCSFVKSISDKNLVRFDSRQEADRTGRRPCKTCSP